MAIVRSGGQVSGWLNGKNAAHLPDLGGGVPNFAIGATAPGRESFRGWIAEVRYSRFQPGQFDPMDDFLLDHQKLKANQAANWLISPPTTPATVQVSDGENDQSAQVMLANGLISRTFLVTDVLSFAPGSLPVGSSPIFVL